jgi:hypothetical protein
MVRRYQSHSTDSDCLSPGSDSRGAVSRRRPGVDGFMHGLLLLDKDVGLPCGPAVKQRRRTSRCAQSYGGAYPLKRGSQRTGIPRVCDDASVDRDAGRSGHTAMERRAKVRSLKRAGELPRGAGSQGVLCMQVLAYDGAPLPSWQELALRRRGSCVLPKQERPGGRTGLATCPAPTLQSKRLRTVARRGLLDAEFAGSARLRRPR